MACESTVIHLRARRFGVDMCVNVAPAALLVAKVA